MTQYSFLDASVIREKPYAEYRNTPRRRIAEQSAEALSDAEILACIIGSSTADAERMLVELGGWIGLIQADYVGLCRLNGISHAKAAQLKAALELGRRLLLAKFPDRYQIRSPTDVAQLMQLEMSHLDQEHLRAIALDTKNRVQQIATVYIGSLNSAQIRIGEVFKDALKRNACAIILCHNHPSGDPTPSPVIWRIFTPIS